MCGIRNSLPRFTPITALVFHRPPSVLMASGSFTGPPRCTPPILLPVAILSLLPLARPHDQACPLPPTADFSLTPLPPLSLAHRSETRFISLTFRPAQICWSAKAGAPQELETAIPTL